MINKPVVLNYKTMPSNVEGVNIMRPSPFGNPFKIPQDGTRNEVCDKFEAYVNSNSVLIQKIKTELKGKNLVCCCKKPNKEVRCHGDTLLRIANEINESDYL